MINLFPQTAEPILLDQQKYEYPVVPDCRRPLAMEVFSVDQVASLNPQQREIVEYQPFYSFRHSARAATASRPSGSPTGAPSVAPDDEGTDVDLALVDLSLRPIRPATDTLTVRTTCTNRDLPARLPFGNEGRRFRTGNRRAGQAHRGSAKPTSPIRPPLGKADAVAPDLAPLAQLSVAGRRAAGRAAADSEALRFHRVGLRRADRFEGITD